MADNDDQLTPEQFLEKYKFPKGTAIANMTDAQEKEYWKYHSRKHEDNFKLLQQENATLKSGSTNVPSDYADLQKKAAAHVKWVEENASDQEKAIRAAREEAFAEGKKQALASSNADIVKMVVGATQNPQLIAMADFVDTNKFVGDDGRVDQAKLQAFITGFGGGAGNQGQENNQQNAGNPDPNNQQNNQQNNGQNQPGPNSHGQGQHPPAATDKMAAGAAKAKERFATAQPEGKSFYDNLL